MSTTYVALLRGINVGGRNKVRMADLAAAFRAHGLADVRTYIQSGNVLFSSDAPHRASLASDVEALLSREFGLSTVVALRSHEELRRIVAEAPVGFGSAPREQLCDVLFLLPPLTPGDVLDQLSLREDVDEAAAGTDVVYFGRLAARRTQSRLSRIMSLPLYRHLTIRSWGTTTKLLALLEA